MESGRPSRLSGRKRLHWRFVLGAILGIAALLVLGAGYLFTGSEVTCAESEPNEDIQLRCSFVVVAAPEAVWEAFTRTGEPRAFYFDAVLEAEMRPGGSWRFVTDDRERLLAGGKILTLEPRAGPKPTSGFAAPIPWP
jgi:hypothetical protein